MATMAPGPSYAPPAPSLNNAPPGTFAPGTKVQVGSHRIAITKYLSEGGFAFVYVVRILAGDRKDQVAVLKRVAVPDKETLVTMRTEVETMKKLQGHKHIVQYIDSHASQLKGGGFEVFLLMEFCAGGGLIDFMNTRLQHRLTEPEILKIFGDVAEGVATMHYLKPPLLHRDLKVENVLITRLPTSTSTVSYKLCDFGSTSEPRTAATNAAEARAIEYDVQRHTTMQYRSPEMVDVWRRQSIDEKSDIWALGVLLYKLCYYTTPFEEVGQMAILTASFKYPPHPSFSSRLKNLIGKMLSEHPDQRPNIYQVVEEVSQMTGRHVPIEDVSHVDSSMSNLLTMQIYTHKTSLRKDTPATEPVGISHVSQVEKQETIPQVAPMRRGRPTADMTPNKALSTTHKTSTGDPFATLDKLPAPPTPGTVDAMSQRFPSLDDFTIAQDSSSHFGPRTPILSEALRPEATTVPLSSSSPIKPTPPQTDRPIWRVPNHSRSQSQPGLEVVDGVQQKSSREPLIIESDDSTGRTSPIRSAGPLPTSDIRKKPSLQLLDLSSPSGLPEQEASIVLAQQDDVRREQERALVLAEERRIARAAAEYRDSPNLKTPVARTSMIQMRVQSLLDDNRAPPLKRTAAGYGRYTETSANTSHGSPGSEQKPKTMPKDDITRRSNAAIRAQLSPSMSAPPLTNRALPAKPAAKPKPASLRTGASPLEASPRSAVTSPEITKVQGTLQHRALMIESQPSRLAALLAKDQLGVAAPGAGSDSDRVITPSGLLATSNVPTPSSQISAPELSIEAFANRYPSISGLDLVAIKDA